MRRQSGFGLLMVLVGILVIAMLAGGGYILWQKYYPASTTTVSYVTPTPTPGYMAGRMVYQFNGNIYTAKLDGSDQQLAVAGSLSGIQPSMVTYAGISKDQNAIYYTEHPVQGYTLKKLSLPGKVATLVTTVDSTSIADSLPLNAVTPLEAPRSLQYAKVSPDEKNALVVTKTGIERYDFVTKGLTMVVAHEDPADCGVTAQASWWQTMANIIVPPVQAAVACTTYWNGQWSPDSKQAMVSADFYEGLAYLKVNPFTTNNPYGSAADITKYPTSGSVAWSPDGTMILSYGPSYGTGNLMVTSSQDSSHSLLANASCGLGDSVTVDQAAWLNNTQLLLAVSPLDPDGPGSDILSPSSLYVCTIGQATATKIITGLTDGVTQLMVTPDGKQALIAQAQTLSDLDVTGHSMKNLPIKADRIELVD